MPFGPVDDHFIQAMPSGFGPVDDHIVVTVPPLISVLIPPEPGSVPAPIRNTLAPMFVTFESPGVYKLEVDQEGRLQGFKF